MKTIAGTVVASLALSALLLAQPTLTGRWEGQTPNRQSIVLELAAKGADLTGTMNMSDQKSPIENGKISKYMFTFDVAMGGGVEAFTGELSDDEIKMWMDDRGPASAIVLKRVKPAQK